MATVPNEVHLQPLHSVYRDDEVISGILNIFVNNLPSYLQDIQSNLQSEDWMRAAGVCHKLKGTASGYGFPEIAMTASDLEVELLDGAKEREAIFDLFDRLKTLKSRALLCV